MKTLLLILLALIGFKILSRYLQPKDESIPQEEWDKAGEKLRKAIQENPAILKELEDLGSHGPGEDEPLDRKEKAYGLHQ